MDLQPTPAQNRRGILAMIASMAIFTANDTFTKLARVDLPVGEILFIRGVFAGLVSLALVVAFGETRKLHLALRAPVLARACMEAAVAFTFILAIGHMPLADLTAIMQTTPLLIALYCALTGIAPMGPRRWAAVVVGFLGVLLVVKPGGAGIGLDTALALGSAVLVASRDMVTRRLDPAIPSVVVLFATSVIVGSAGAALSLVESWKPVSGVTVAMLGTAGFCVAIGHLCAIIAFRGVDVAVVSPFRYSVMLWATLAGFVVFGDVPDAAALCGSALIAGSGLYTVHRERIRAAEAARLSMEAEAGSST